MTICKKLKCKHQVERKKIFLSFKSKLFITEFVELKILTTNSKFSSMYSPFKKNMERLFAKPRNILIRENTKSKRLFIKYEA